VCVLFYICSTVTQDYKEHLLVKHTLSSAKSDNSKSFSDARSSDAFLVTIC